MRTVKQNINVLTKPLRSLSLSLAKALTAKHLYATHRLSNERKAFISLRTGGDLAPILQLRRSSVVEDARSRVKAGGKKGAAEEVKVMDEQFGVPAQRYVESLPVQPPPPFLAFIWNFAFAFPPPQIPPLSFSVFGSVAMDVSSSATSSDRAATPEPNSSSFSGSSQSTPNSPPEYDDEEDGSDISSPQYFNSRHSFNSSSSSSIQSECSFDEEEESSCSSSFCGSENYHSSPSTIVSEGEAYVEERRRRRGFARTRVSNDVDDTIPTKMEIQLSSLPSSRSSSPDIPKHSYKNKAKKTAKRATSMVGRSSLVIGKGLGNATKGIGKGSFKVGKETFRATKKVVKKLTPKTPGAPSAHTTPTFAMKPAFKSNRGSKGFSNDGLDHAKVLLLGSPAESRKKKRRKRRKKKKKTKVETDNDSSESQRQSSAVPVGYVIKGLRVFDSAFYSALGYYLCIHSHSFPNCLTLLSNHLALPPCPPFPSAAMPNFACPSQRPTRTLLISPPGSCLPSSRK